MKLAAEPSLFTDIPESYRQDPAIKAYIGLLASYTLAGVIVPSEAEQLAAYTGFLLGEGTAERPEE